MTKRNLGGLVLLAALGLAAFWLMTKPRPIAVGDLPKHTADLKNGEMLFNAAGCHSCHLPAKDSKFDPASVAGGAPLHTPVGTLYPANITPDPETGIGQWTAVDFVNAMQKGISRSGQHLIPAFPYTSYTRMKTEDVLDIFAYLKSLPAQKNAVPAHDVLGLPLVRFALGGWKLLGFDETKIVADTTRSDSWNRGKYLVDGPGHCGECHTPRTVFMTSNTSQYLAGGPHPEGDGKVPSLRGLIERGRYKDARDIASALQFGALFGYDKLASGGMGKVQANLAKLPEADIQAIGEYLASLK